MLGYEYWCKWRALLRGRIGKPCDAKTVGQQFVKKDTRRGCGERAEDSV